MPPFVGRCSSGLRGPPYLAGNDPQLGCILPYPVFGVILDTLAASQAGGAVRPDAVRQEAANREATARAKALIKRIPMSEDEYYAMAAPELAKGSQHDMENAAASDRMTTRQICEQIRDDPATAVGNLTYAKVNPTGYQVLMGADRSQRGRRTEWVIVFANDRFWGANRSAAGHPTVGRIELLP
jgi:hypothetical protein